jgi:hypothetical protein
MAMHDHVKPAVMTRTDDSRLVYIFTRLRLFTGDPLPNALGWTAG